MPSLVPPFFYRSDRLCCEADVPLADIAQTVGTPVYVYSASAIRDRYRAFADAFRSVETLICYAMKANCNLAVLRLLADEGSGFDVNSEGELRRVLQAGARPEKIIFGGVGKTADELRAGLRAGLKMIKLESLEEINLIARVARELGTVAPVGLRLNPDVDPKTHPYISTGLKENKFGIAAPDAERAIAQVARHPDALRLVGLDMHIGSQVTDLDPYAQATARLVGWAEGATRDLGLTGLHLDLGGGLGIGYESDDVPGPTPAALADRLLPLVTPYLRATAGTLMLEPGRALVGASGALVTEVLYTKQQSAYDGDPDPKAFVVVDGAMTEVIRPSLYKAHHRIVPLERHPERVEAPVDVVGPVCETGDFLAKGRAMSAVAPGERLAVLDAGAYASVMGMTYNARRRPPEVLVEGDAWRLVRRRETYDELMTLETDLDREGYP